MEVVGGGGKRGVLRKFLMIYWGRDQNFYISQQEKCTTNLPLLLQFQIINFSTKRHSQI